MDFFTQLFTHLNTSDSIAILAFLLGAYLIGLLSGRWSISRKHKKLKKAHRQQEVALTTLKAEHEALQGQLDPIKESLENTRQELAQTQEQYQTALAENKKCQNQLQAAEESNQNLQAINRTYTKQIDDLGEQVIQVQAQNEDLAVQLTAAQTKATTTTTPSNGGTQDRLQALEQKLILLERDAGSPANVDPADLEMVKRKIGLLEQENKRLRTDLEDLRIVEEEIPVVLLSDEEDMLPEEFDTLTSEERAIRARTKLKRAFGSSIPLATLQQKDNLQKIDGIGPFIESQLNKIGFYTFEQISRLDAETIQLVTEAIQFFPGRIVRDEWVEQARRIKA